MTNRIKKTATYTNKAAAFWAKYVFQGWRLSWRLKLSRTDAFIEMFTDCFKREIL